MLDDGSHWYKADGTACHQVKKVRGSGMTNTTIAHARKMGLLPSVTAVLGVMDKPQLKRWCYRQITDWCFDNPAKYNEDIYFQNAVEGAFKQVKHAADAGTLIHAGIEGALMGEPWDHMDDVYLPEINTTCTLSTFVDPVLDWVKENNLTPIECEKRAVNVDVGYAGTMDMAFRDKDGLPVTGDTKTRKTKPNQKCEPYDGQPMQIAAYDVAYWERGEYGFKGSQYYSNQPKRGFNLFVSTTEPGRVEVAWYSAEQLRAEYRAFCHLCAVWQHFKNYTPSKRIKELSK